jgi:hypothetical protein
LKRGATLKTIPFVLLLGGVLLAGCAERHYRVYDSYHSDYHTWNSGEVVYYHQWAGETHRDPNRDFRHIPSGEQKEYWDWRHNHSDHDHH